MTSEKTEPKDSVSIESALCVENRGIYETTTRIHVCKVYTKIY